MDKKMTTAAVRQSAAQALNAWEESKKDIKLPAKDLFILIGLKKQLEQKLSEIEEAIMMVAIKHNGVQNEDGSISIPEESRVAAGKELNDFAKEEININSDKIFIDSDSFLPIPIFEAFYDFLEIKE